MFDYKDYYEKPTPLRPTYNSGMYIYLEEHAKRQRSPRLGLKPPFPLYPIDKTFRRDLNGFRKGPQVGHAPQ